MVANLTGGREGKKFIIAWHAVGGSWPTIPNNQDFDRYDARGRPCFLKKLTKHRNDIAH